MTVIRDLDALNPKFKPIVVRRADALARDYKTGLLKTDFQVFETFRSPLRQNQLLAKGTTKAAAFQSAHAFGLAVDFVPRVNGRWTWDGIERSEWEYMRKKANAFGLSTPIEWDLPHVEHPLFDDMWHAMKMIGLA